MGHEEGDVEAAGWVIAGIFAIIVIALVWNLT